MEDDSGKQAVPICEECKINPSKYKCPGCSIRSCSLPCVKAHKQRTSCSGKKHYNDVVPISQFDDNLLLSDYNMLEDVKRVADSARRKRVKMCGNNTFILPFPLKSLRNAAFSRKIKLLYFYPGMSKREKNQSYYNYRKKCISWTIEWRFHTTNVVLHDHGIHENSSLLSVVENHLQNSPWKHELRQFCEEPLDSLKFFICKYPKGQNSPYRELNIKEPLRPQLARLTIVEYPVIHVFLPSHSYNFVVVKDVIPQRAKVKESSTTDNLDQMGVTFREVEIEEDTALETRVTDLACSANLHGNLKACSQKLGMDDNSEELVNTTCSDIQVAEGWNLDPSDSMDLPDLSELTIPDDFMDFGDAFEEGLDLLSPGKMGFSELRDLEEEVEEGEMADSSFYL